MQLTDLQLDIMKLWASKELSFGCILSLYNSWYIHDYTTYYTILWSEIIKRELSFSSCNFPNNYIFVDSLTDTDEWVMKDDKNKLYIEQKKWYLLSNMFWNLIYYWHNVKMTPEEMIKKSHDLYKDISLYKIIWHPTTRWRLCYLKSKIRTSPEKRKMRDEITYNFKLNPELYNQDILTRNDGVLDMVRDFLLSIQ